MVVTHLVFNIGAENMSHRTQIQPFSGAVLALKEKHQTVLGNPEEATKAAVKVGYGRVSTQEQNLDLQEKALRDAGCHVIYKDEGVSGALKERPALNEALESVSEGDTLVVWKLDRLARSASHLLEVCDDLKSRGVGFQSLTESIDTTTPMGKFYFTILSGLAEFERDLIIERTKAGIQAAKARGQHCGRPRKLNLNQLRHAKELLDEGRSRNEVARLFGVDPSTLYRRLAEA
jgi:DNA invertase Pin-like site-specific DNA recombinase